MPAPQTNPDADLQAAINEYHAALAGQAAGPRPQAPVASPAPQGSPQPAPTQNQSLRNVPSAPVKPGLVQGALKAVGDFVQGAAKEGQTILANPGAATAGAAAGVLRAPGNAIGGVIDASNDMGTFVGDSINHALVRTANQVGLPGVASYLQMGNQVSHRTIPTVKEGGASFQDKLSLKNSLGKVGLPEVNQFSAEAVGVGAAAAVAPEGIVGRALGTAAGSFIAQKPNSTDHPILERAGNAAIGAGMEVGGHLALSAIGSQLAKIKNANLLKTTIQKATPEEAVAENLDKGFAEDRTQQAKAQAAAAQYQTAGEPTESASPAAASEAPTGVVPPSRHTDTPPSGAASAYQAGGDDVQAGVQKGAKQPAQGPQGAQGVAEAPAPPPFIRDANQALNNAGVAERLPEDGTHTLTSDGKLQVDPTTMASVKNTPYGRAFTAAGEEDPQYDLFKEKDSEGGQRVVFKATPEGLNSMLEDAEHYAKNPGEIDIKPGSPPYDKVGQWTFTLGSADDVAPIGRVLADRMEGERRPLSDDDYRKMAEQTGQDPVIMAAVAHDMAAGKEPTFSQGGVIRSIAAQTSKAVAALRGTDWTTLEPDHPDVQAALQAVHNAYTWAEYLQRFKYYAGLSLRSLQFPLDVPGIKYAIAKLAGVVPDLDGYAPAQSIPDLGTLQRNFGKIPKDQLSPIPPGMAPPFPRNGEELNDMLEQHAFLSKWGPKAEAAFWQGRMYRPSALNYVRQSIASLFTANLVSAPSTFARDMLGPAIYSALRTLERTSGAIPAYLANTMAASAKALTGSPEEAAMLQAAARDALTVGSQAPYAYVRSMGDILDSTRAGVSALLHNDGAVNTLHNPIDYNAVGNIPQALIDAAKGEGDTLQADLYSLGNAINIWPNAVHNLHGGVAETAFRQSYAGEVRAGAMLEASQQGLQGDDFWDHVKMRLMAAPDALTSPDMNVDPLYKRSYDTAMQTGFISQVGAQGSVARKMATFLGNLRQTIPETRFILPIFTVPANNMGAVLSHIPGVNLLFKSTRDALTGDAGPIAQAEAYGRMIVGGTILALTAVGARAGLITGAGPERPSERESWRASGMTPYSIHIGGQWYGFNRFDLAGQIMGIAANVNDHTIYRDRDDPNVALTGAAAIAETLKDQSSLKGMADFIDFMSNPGRNQSILRQMVNDDAAGLAVPRALQTLVTNNLDAHQYVTRTPMEAILAALPGDHSMLDPMRNFLGEDVMRAPQAGPMGVLPITTSSQRTDKDDPVMTELHRLAVSSGFSPAIPSPTLPGAKVDQRDIMLEDGHSLYDARMRYRMQPAPDGSTLRGDLQDLFDSDRYKSAVDGSEDPSLGDSKNKLIADVFKKWTKTATNGVVNDSPQAANWLVAAKLKQHNTANLAGFPVAKLTTDAGMTLAKSLGVDVDATTSKVTGQ